MAVVELTIGPQAGFRATTSNPCAKHAFDYESQLLTLRALGNSIVHVFVPVVPGGRPAGHMEASMKTNRRRDGTRYHASRASRHPRLKLVSSLERCVTLSLAHIVFPAR